MFTVYVYEPMFYREFEHDLYFRYGNVVYRFNSDSGLVVNSYFHNGLINNPDLVAAML